ncbi:MAG: DNA repair protein RecN [Tissierellia bacterium]|nr:DNA repair protein RecN [Tissierellia bacterium]
MIVELNISNFAIIDDLKINFTRGFNVITGETGAGKSIIVEGIGMILGGRASKELIKSGKDKATIEGLFYLENPERINILLKNYGIDIDPNNYLLISREIHSNGPSISRLNGRTVTLSMLNSITSYLVDIHGQHEHQSLLNTDNHIKFIDSFGDDYLFNLIEKINNNYKKLSEEKKKLRELSIDTIERDREIDLLKYQLEEIIEGDLSKYDEEEIIKEYTKITNIQEIAYNLGEIANILNSSDYNNVSVLDNINRAIVKTNEIQNFDNRLAEYNNILTDINFQLQDLSRDIMNYIETLELDQDRLNFLEERIDTVNNLKRKYGNTIEEIYKYKENIEKRINILTNIEREIEKSNNKISILEKELTQYCNTLTNLRKELGNKLEILITKELKDLNMNNVVFKVKYDKLDYFTANGWDKIEFLISTNKGEDLKPLSKIISGGEMSRIMLAFKSILADVDNIPCLIFDEIDSGISGRTAQIVGEKIKMISKNHQIISISHLPQIAALADTHFLIEKEFINNHTITTVRKLDNNERVDELARLLGGVDLTDTTKLHAREMLDMSQKLES